MYLHSLPSSLNPLKSRLYYHILKFHLLFVKISDNVPVSLANDKIDNNTVTVLQ